jgi:hypothetical protein
MADGLDRRLLTEFLPQAPHTDFDDVRARVEVVPPHLVEEAFAADHLAGMQREVVEEPKLAIG